MVTRIEKVREQVESTVELSTLPQTLARILDVILDEKSDAKQLADEIAHDQVLTAKVLRIVNSAFYGFYRKITNISDAVVLMGYNEIRSVVMAVTAVDMFQSDGVHRTFRNKLWEHTLNCAATTEVLAQSSHRDEDAAFVTGLLHDIGKVVLDQIFPDEYHLCVTQSEGDSQKLRDLEEETFGVGHPEVGSWLLERWDLPPHIIEAVRFHHQPGLAREAYHLTSLVHVGNALVHRWANETVGREIAPRVNVKACQEVELSGERARDARVRVTQRMESLQTVITP